MKKSQFQFICTRYTYGVCDFQKPFKGYKNTCSHYDIQTDGCACRKARDLVKTKIKETPWYR